jgi:hypothetical protein
MYVDAYGFQALLNFGFLSFKAHVRQHIWFSSSILDFGFFNFEIHVPRHIWFSSSLQLWIFELQKPCELAHMVFKLFSTLDYQA